MATRCIHCKSPNTIEAGYTTGRRIKRYECKNCGRTFIKDYVSSNRLTKIDTYLSLQLYQKFSNTMIGACFRVSKQAIREAIFRILKKDDPNFLLHDTHLDIWIENVECEIIKQAKFVKIAEKRMNAEKTGDWIFVKMNLGENRGDVYILKPLEKEKEKESM